MKDNFGGQLMMVILAMTVIKDQGIVIAAIMILMMP